MDFFFSIIHKHTHTHTSSQFTFALSLAHIIIAHLSVTDHPATLTPHPFPIFGTALLIVHLPPISPYPLKLPSNHPPTPHTQRDTLFLLTPTPPGCSRSQVSMVTLLQNVRAIFGLFVSSNQPVIHTCSPADTQPADCSVPQ